MLGMGEYIPVVWPGKGWMVSSKSIPPTSKRLQCHAELLPVPACSCRAVLFLAEVSLSLPLTFFNVVLKRGLEKLSNAES